MEPDFIPVIMSYKDGLELEDMPEFITACQKFAEMAKEDYKGKNIRLFFLPEDLAKMMMEASDAQSK